MELNWGHLSADARIGGGLFDVIRLFTHFYLAPGQKLKLPNPTYLCLSFHAHQNEVPAGLPLRLDLQLRAAFGDKFSDPRQVDMIWNSIGPGYPFIGSARIGLTGWELPKSGLYFFHTRIDGKPVGKVGLSVLPAPGSTVRPYTGAKRGFKLEWGHVTDHIEPHAAGVISLHGISDFLVLPKHVDFVLLSAELAVLVSGGPDDGPDHEIQYVLVDSDDKPQGEPLVRKLQGQQIEKGGRWYYSDAVRLQDVMLEGGHDYTFRLSIDGNLLPDSVSYWALKANDFKLETR